jgi:hypothetical protein
MTNILQKLKAVFPKKQSVIHSVEVSTKQEVDLQGEETDAEIAASYEIERLNKLREAAEKWQAHVDLYARIINTWPAGLTSFSTITQGATA